MWRATLLRRPPAARWRSTCGISRSSTSARDGTGRGGVEEAAVHLGENVGRLVGGAAEHHAVDVFQMPRGRVEVFDAAVENDRQLGMRGLEPVHAVVVERRDLAVLLRRQTVEPGLARVHDEGAAAGAGDRIDEALQVGLAVLLIDADAAFDGHRHGDALLHGGDAGGDQLRLRHEAGAEAALLHAVGGAADVEVDLGVAEAFTDRGGFCERGRIGAAELQGDGIVGGRVGEQARAVAVQDGVSGDHLGVEQRVARHEAVEGAAMPIRPVHHGRDAKSMTFRLHGFVCPSRCTQTRACAL